MKLLKQQQQQQQQQQQFDNDVGLTVYWWRLHIKCQSDNSKWFVICELLHEFTWGLHYGMVHQNGHLCSNFT